MAALVLNAVEIELLACLNSFEVRYLVVGGHAVAYHGYSRSMKDLDLFIGTSLDNAGRSACAGYPPVHALQVEEGLPRRQAQSGGRGCRVELAESVASAEARSGEAGAAAAGEAAGSQG